MLKWSTRTVSMCPSDSRIPIFGGEGGLVCALNNGMCFASFAMVMKIVTGRINCEMFGHFKHIEIAQGRMGEKHIPGFKHNMHTADDKGENRGTEE